MIILIPLNSNSEGIFVDDADAAQAMEILDMENLPVDPRFAGL